MKGTITTRSLNKATVRATGFVHVMLLVLFLLGATTYGVVTFQYEVAARTAKYAKVTPAALDAGKRALLAYAHEAADRPYAYEDQVGIKPKVNVRSVWRDGFISGVSGDIDIFIANRPGQLPCPDVVGDATNLYTETGFIGTDQVNDGNLDGVADPGFSLCSSTLAEPLAQGSRFGRLPWREFTDFANYVRGVGYADITDGNNDRLWYAASRNLTDVSRPLNPYKILREPNNWLQVVVTFHPPGTAVLSTAALSTVNNVAAVVLSPGQPIGTRTLESSILAPGGILATNLVANAALAGQYFEDATVYPNSNIDDDDIFTNNIGSVPNWADRLSYVHRDEILASFDEFDASPHLDNIADTLENYYQVHKHLPDPATFEEQNSQFIVRRFGRTSDGISPLLYSPSITTTIAVTEDGLENLRTQGGRVEYDFSPAQLNVITIANPDPLLASLTITNYTVSNPDRLRISGSIPVTDVKEIFLNPSLLITAGTSGTLNDVIPPYTEYLHLGGTAPTASQSFQTWRGIIPAGTPVRTTTPLYTYQDRPAAGTPFSPSAISSIDVTTALNGNYYGTSGDYNVLFADLRPGFLGNLSDLGYAAQVPRGTWIRTDQDLTIAGTETQTINIGGTDYADDLHSFALVDPPQGAEFTYGVTRDTSVTPFTVPAKTAIVPGSQGLLPAPLLPGQLPIPPNVDLTAAAFFEQLAIDQENFALGTVEKINRAENEVARITDPLGGFGYFPAEVTMHPLFNHPVTRGSVPAIANRYQDLTSSPTDSNNRTSVQPYPISSGNKPIAPTALTVDGIISMPVGTKFYYPPGAKIPLGPHSFSHGTSDRVMSTGANPNAVEGAIITTDTRVLAHLPAGAVLGNVSVPADSILPDGSVLSTAQFFERMTLTHGGALSFDQLLHYDDGNFSQLPLTNEQAAFRIEAMGMALDENNTSVNDLPSLLLLNANNVITLSAISTVTNSDGYQLFPYHDAVIAKSRSINLVSSITLDNPRTLEYTSSTLTYLDNPISRAQLSIYNIGANLSSVTVTISPAINRSALATIIEPSYALVDELGVGVEAATDGSAIVSVDSTIDIRSTVSPISTITLNYDRGVEMQANPGRLYLSPTSITNTITVGAVTSTVTVVNNYLSFNQFGPQETNTPLVAPFAPGQDSFSTSLTDNLLDVFRLTTTITVDPVSGVTTTMDIPDTISIDPRSAEIALHLDQETTLNTFTSTTLTPAPSDRISLGEQLDISRRVFLSLRSDAVLHDYDTATSVSSVKTIVPAGVRAEFGVLEQTIYDSTSGEERLSHHFVPGGRIFSGVGFYPLNAQDSTALRFNRDQSSFLGPTTITIGVVTDVQPAVPPLDITIFYGANAVSSTIISDPLMLTNIVVSDPQLIVPAGADFTAGTYDETFSLDSGATTITVYLFDNDLALVGSSMVINGATLANPLLKPPQDIADPNGNASMFITIDDTDDTLNDTDDEQNLAFTFVANGPGVVVSDDAGRAGRTDRVNDGQVVRLRLAPDQVDYTDGANAQGPELHPLLELAWSGVDSALEHIDFDPDSLIFNQNNPIFYAVAPDCRKDLAVDGEDCTDDENAGLNVQVLAGEEVRLPEPSVTPPGLLIYGFRDPRHEPDQLQAIYVDVASTTTVTVNGVRIRANGMVDFLNIDPSASNLLTVDISIATATSGTTLELIPGARGLQFQYEPDETLTTVTLTNPINPSPTRGYTEPLSIFVGGFTYENLALADYRQTISAASTITLGTGSQIFKDNENIRNSLYFAPGSTFDSSGTATDGSDLFLINGNTGGIEVTLAADAARASEGLGLPQSYATSGETITIGNPVASTVTAVAEIVDLADGTLITLDQPGYAWQGIIRGTSITANLLRDPDQTAYEAYPAVRNYNFDQPKLFPATPRPFDLAMPQHYGLENTFLTTYQDTTWETTVASTININDCYLCSSLTIDISALANSFVSDPVTSITVYSYPQTITVDGSNVAAELDGSLEFGTDTVPVWALVGQDFVGMEFETEAVNSSGITITHTGPSLTVSIGPPSTVAAFTTLPSFDFAGTGLSIDTSMFVVDRNIEVLEVTGATTLTTITALTNEPTHTAELTFATSLAFDLGELPAETGFTLDRHGNVPTVLTVGQPIELPAPLALYRNPNAMQLAGIAATASWTPATSPAPVIDAGQLFIDRRVLNPTTPVDPPIFQELRLSLTGDENNREIGLHVPVPTMVIAGEEVYAGSLIFPETGRMVKANRFNNTAPLIITLGANGAVAHVTGSGGVGRPSIFNKNLTVTTTINAFPEFEETVGLTYNLEDGVDLVAATSDQYLTINSREMIFKLDTAGTHTEIVDADFRAMDAVLRRPTFVYPTIPPINLPELADLWLAPTAHRINIPATSEITINAPGNFASFRFPALSTIDYQTPTTADAILTATTDIGDWTIDQIIATPSLNPHVIKGQTLTLEDRHTQFTTPPGIDRGTNHDVSALTNHLYQNVWIRIADNLTVTFASGAEIDLPANSVINPFLGTYLPAAFQEVEQAAIDRLSINAPSTAVSQTELVMSRPALRLPAGITIAVGSEPLTFTDVKAIIGHSPSPLSQPVNCAAVGQGTSLLTVDQNTERVSTNILPEVEYNYDDSTAALGLSGVIKSASGQIGDAHPCMLLDLPENTDWDSWFIYGSGTRYDASTNYPYVNDQFRMIGGKLQL